MKYEIAKLVMIVAAASIFFALVHPWAVDPIGFGKVELLADSVAPAPSLLISPAIQATIQPAVFPPPPSPLLLLDVTELNCTLTC